MSGALASPRGAAACALLLCLSACGGGSAERADRATVVAATAITVHGPTRAPDLTLGEDVLAEVLAHHHETKAPPPTVFRRGHVASMSLPAEAIVKSEGSFRVRLPSGAPIVTPTVHGDLVVVSGGFRSQEMYAFRARDGDLAWALRLDDDGPSNAACDEGVCVFNTESCTIYGVEAATGRLLWSWYLGDPLMSAPTVAGGLAFSAYPAHGGASRAPGEDRPAPEGVSHALAAFDLRTGELRWARWIDADVISAPVVVADAVYAASFGGTLYKMDAASGEILAARRARATSAPTLVDGALYFSRRADAEGEVVRESIARSARKQDAPAQESAARPAEYLTYDFQDDTAYGEMSVSLDAANGFSGGAPAAANTTAAMQLLGRRTVHGLQEYQGSWVLGLGAANFASMGDALVSFDRHSGAERWSVPLPGDLQRLGGALAAPPAAAGGRLVLATLVGELLVVSPEDGAVDRRIVVGAPMRTQPVVDRGWIYAGTADGQLVAFDTGEPTMTGWTTWGANAARTGAPPLAAR